MPYDHKKLDRAGKLVADALLLVLLWGILVLPATTFTLLRFDTSQNDVLSGKNARDQVQDPSYDETRTVRETTQSNTEDLTIIVQP